MVADHQSGRDQGRVRLRRAQQDNAPTLFRTLLAVGGIILGAMGAAQAQSFPSRPITLVVPFAAGGPTDTIARIFADRLRTSLGRDRAWSRTSPARPARIGTGRVVRAAPDGYTVLIGHWSTHVVNGAIYPLTFDLLNDFEPISLIASNPQLLVARKAAPAERPAGADRLGEGQPGQDLGRHRRSGRGVACQRRLLPERDRHAGSPSCLIAAPGPALQDVVAGNLDLMFDQAASALPQVRNGNVKAFAVTAKKRLTSAPDIPTVDEAGLPNFYIAVWHALWLPKGTPKDIVMPG